MGWTAGGQGAGCCSEEEGERVMCLASKLGAGEQYTHTYTQHIWCPFLLFTSWFMTQLFVFLTYNYLNVNPLHLPNIFKSLCPRAHSLAGVTGCLCALCGSLAMSRRWEWGAAAVSSPADQGTRALWTHRCLPSPTPHISHPDVQLGLFSVCRGSGSPPWHVHTGCCPRGESHGRTQVEEGASALGAIDRLCSCVWGERGRGRPAGGAN